MLLQTTRNLNQAMEMVSIATIVSVFQRGIEAGLMTFSVGSWIDCNRGAIDDVRQST